MALMLGNGSDELIQLLCQAVINAPISAGRKPVVLAPEPGFVMYRMLATACGLEYQGVALRDDFALNLPAMLDAIHRHRPALVFLAYPNNPTGNLFDREAVEAILRAAPGLVILDEAYHPFAESSFMDHLGKFDNLLVMRTVSKLGLAGIRLGVLAGPECWLHELNKLRLPYNINVLTQVTAKLVCETPDIFQQQARLIREERQRVYKALDELLDIQPYPSRANFILFKTAAGQANHTHQWLKQRYILIKNLSSAGGLLADCLRVTVGTPEENDTFLAAMRTIPVFNVGN
jgi:histidinol-phosphate aminotransferase